ncbi:hypothetical protein GGR56DRAFT_675887 [Xylariaceae sp. FL0804]|nr:hypothetical protein GGR56DRAFT_675887 [Xylariaceae sp. FL0804]
MAVAAAIPQTSPAGLSVWICHSLAEVLFLARLGLRRWWRGGQPFTAGDGWVALAAALVGVRMGLGWYTNVWQTPLGMVAEGRTPADYALTPDVVYYMGLAGKLSIVLRIVFACILWSLKMAVVDLLRGLLRRLQYERPVLYSTYAFLAVTFLASLLAVFLECRPLSMYWKLFLVDEMWAEVSNILTDALLLALPFPMILRARVPVWKRVRLSVVFGLGFLLIAVSIIRLARGRSLVDTQMNRIFWGSMEVGVASTVATIPTIYILLRPSAGRQTGNVADQTAEGSSWENVVR